MMEPMLNLITDHRLIIQEWIIIQRKEIIILTQGVMEQEILIQIMVMVIYTVVLIMDIPGDIIDINNEIKNPGP